MSYMQRKDHFALGLVFRKNEHYIVIMKVTLVPILTDNYVFVIHNESEALVVDPGLDEKVISYLHEQKLTLKGILITHHHWDHTGDAAKLAAKYTCPIYAPKEESSSIPYADFYVNSQDNLNLLGLQIQIYDLPGHTRGHLGYYIPHLKSFFCGDVLFGLGCGRLLEGTYAQMFQSLGLLKSLPSDTKMYCTHEYTLTNLKFTESLVAPLAPSQYDLVAYRQNAVMLRNQNLATVPLDLGAELKTNPFLLASSLEDFKKIRDLRNVFKT